MKSIGSLIDLCTEKKVNLLVLPDGTQIHMNVSAFFPETEAVQPLKPNQSTDFKIENHETLDDTMDEELLYQSARG
jgi:hypothetical protein